MGYESTQPLLEQLWDVHGAERQLAKALQAVAASVASTKLATAFRQHLAETEGHLRKLEQVMTLLGVPAKTRAPEATDRLLVDRSGMLRQDGEAFARDVTVSAEAPRASRYAVGAFDATGETLTLLGLDEVTRLFEETLTSAPATDAWRPVRGGSDVDPQALLESGGALG